MLSLKNNSYRFQELIPGLIETVITQSTITALKLIDINFLFPFCKIVFEKKVSALDFDFWRNPF